MSVLPIITLGDPRLRLKWPLPVKEISTKDAAWAPLDKIEAELKRKMSA